MHFLLKNFSFLSFNKVIIQRENVLDGLGYKLYFLGWSLSVFRLQKKTYLVSFIYLLNNGCQWIHCSQIEFSGWLANLMTNNDGNEIKNLTYIQSPYFSLYLLVSCAYFSPNFFPKWKKTSWLRQSFFFYLRLVLLWQGGRLKNKVIFLFLFKNIICLN